MRTLKPQPVRTAHVPGILPDAAGAPTGTPLSDPPLVEMISEDPVLRGTKLIAEAWDCDGLNQACLGSPLEQVHNAVPIGGGTHAAALFILQALVLMHVLLY